MGSRVTTKNGDDGTTRTLAGDQLSKAHIVLECTGAVDSLRAHTALIRTVVLEQQPQDHDAVAAFLFWLLHVYFLIGTEVNDPEAKHPEYRAVALTDAHLKRLEEEQARLEAAITLPRAFIACAGNVLAAQADIAATVARQLEREVVRLKAEVPAFDDAVILPFVNRVSDYLYILARYLEEGQHVPVDYSVVG